MGLTRAGWAAPSDPRAHVAHLHTGPGGWPAHLWSSADLPRKGARRKRELDKRESVQYFHVLVNVVYQLCSRLSLSVCISLCISLCLSVCMRRKALRRFGELAVNIHTCRSRAISEPPQVMSLDIEGL